MRSYIFTEHERRVLREWLSSGIELQGIRVIFSRIRLYKKLREDVELYQLVREKIAV